MKMTLKAVAALLGMDDLAAHRYVTQKQIPALSERGGRGNPLMLDARGIVAMAMVKTLRNQKVSMPTISRLTKFLHEITAEELLAAFDRGETILVSAGDALPPRLMVPTQAIHNRTGADTFLVAFNLGAAYQRIVNAVAKRSTFELVRTPNAAEPTPAA